MESSTARQPQASQPPKDHQQQKKKKRSGDGVGEAKRLKSNSGRQVVNSGADLAALLDAEEVIVRRLLAPGMPRRACDVYVTLKTNFKAQLERCKSLLDTRTCSSSKDPATPGKLPPMVWIHGLGAAHSRAINLALQLQIIYPGLQISPLTSTVNCRDEVETFKGASGSSNTEEKIRPQSAIHIKLFFV